MLESNLLRGNQKLKEKQNLLRGQSITDACIDIHTTKMLLSLLNNLKPAQINTLGSLRMLIRDYDQLIYEQIITETNRLQEKTDLVLTDHLFEKDKIVEEICRNQPNAETLSMLITLRLALSEKVADLKFRANPYLYLNKANDFLKLVTDREIEKTNLKLFNTTPYLKIMDISKMIQVEYLQTLTQTIKIGYLFGMGTFSGEAVQKFRGSHISYSSIAALKTAFSKKEIDYILIPTYNSIIGEILQPEAYWDQQGTVDQPIELCLLSNTNNSRIPKKIYLERHIERESQTYLDKYKELLVIPVISSLEGCLRCIKDTEPALTISSKKNISNFLFTVESDIVEHNVTTFTLYSI